MDTALNRVVLGNLNQSKIMRTIAVVNQKGGCGKTTVSINLTSALAKMGHRTLLVDMDPQSHCAVGLAVPEEQIEQSIYDILISKSKNEPVKLEEILWNISDGLELAPSCIDLSAFESQTSGIAKRECCLKNTLSEVKEKYDYVIIDCPPAVGLLTLNALRASNDVIVPVDTGYFSLHGLSKQLETLNILREQHNQHINVCVLASMYDIRTKMAREIMAELRTHFAEKMFTTCINFNTKIKEAASFGQPIDEYDPASKGRTDFRTLAEEVVGSESRQHQHQIVNSLATQLEAISSTADELLQENSALRKEDYRIRPQQDQQDAKQTLSIEPTKALKAENEKTVDINTKLSDYYGVSQINGAIVFVTLYPRAGNVQIAGDFNNWQPKKTNMEKIGNNGVWQTKLNLPTGKYRYRLVVDGHWQQDPYNKSTKLNPFGGFDSVIEVK